MKSSGTKTADLRNYALNLRSRAVLRPDHVAVVFRAEADRLDRMAAELEDEK